MFRRIHFLIVAAVAGACLVALADGMFMKPTCPNFEYYKKCGSPCEITCKNLLTPNFCGFGCLAGCNCLPGFFRNSNGTCVIPTMCT